ncbi:MAG: hypothetical protein AAB552_02000 [Patescibacteria group bacterium]
MQLRTFPASLAVLVVAIAVVNFFAHTYYWYRLFFWFDMMMHFAGGAWLSGVAIWWQGRKLAPETVVTFKTLVLVGVGTALAIGVLWEGYEVIVGVVVEGRVNALADTLSDIFFDTLGAVLVVAMVVRKHLVL